MTTQPVHGTLSGTAPNLIYTPSANYHGSDSFAFKANDGLLDSTPALVSITVTSVNDAPVATPQAVELVEDGTAAITLAGTDVDGDSLSFTVTTQPAHGTLSGTAPNLTYTPSANYHGSDSFTFTVNDGILDSTPALVSITVTSVNDAPVATPQAVDLVEDETAAITLEGTDVDGDSLSFTVTTQPAHGTLSGTAPNLTYTPTANYHGSDSFAFKANDGLLDSIPALVSITVTSANNSAKDGLPISWKLLYGLDPNTTDDLADDSDHDGLSLLMEYALNQSPLVDSSAALPVVTTIVDSSDHLSYLTYTYLRRTDAPQLTYVVQTSDDLITWHSGAEYTQEVSTTPSGDGVTNLVTTRILPAISENNRQRLVRLQVSSP